MQRYYFHIEGDGVEIQDAMGVVLSTSSGLTNILESLIKDVSLEEDWIDDPNAHYRMRVTDDTGATIVVVPLEQPPGTCQRAHGEGLRSVFAH